VAGLLVDGAAGVEQGDLAVGLVLDGRVSERSEFRFLISHLVPITSLPAGRTETLASTRIEPSSIRPSEAPVATSTARSSAT